MGLIPQSTIDEVLARTDILQVVQQYVTLKRAGSNHKGLCPFHSEKTPSFNVNPSKGIYKCFGCGAGGNVLGFLMEIEGWNFPETVRHLAERNGVEIPEESDEDRESMRKRREGKKAYLRVMELAREFYQESLWSDRGRAARQYLAERGVDEETARTFQLGYAPEGWEHLISHLASHQIPPSWAARAGLALARNRGEGHYDRFRHRVMFPVIDIWGNTVAFGGRVFAANDDSPKYVNSSETAFYIKGDHLYGLHAAKKGIQDTDHAVLVEGNFDVITLYAAGVRNAVSPMGTAFTARQAKLLSRYARKVVVAFDGDSAGKAASMKTIEPFQNADIEARVVRFDDGEDPDSFVRDQGVTRFKELVEEADDLVGWALDEQMPRAEAGDVHRNIEGLTAAGEILRQVKSPVAQRRYASEISRRLAIEPRLLNEYIERPREQGKALREAMIAAQEAVDLDPVEFNVLAVLTDHSDWLGGFLAEEYDKLLISEELANFLHSAADYVEANERFDGAVLLEQIRHVGFREAVQRAMFADDLYPDDRAKQFYEDCVRKLKLQWADRTLKQITRALETVDFRRERNTWEELTRKKQQVEQFKVSMDAME